MKKILFLAFALFGAAGFAGCSDDDPDAPLVVPTDVKCVARSENALSFAWNAVEGAANYHYQFATGDGRTLFTNTVAEPQVMIADLAATTAYKFRVQACGASGMASEYSAYITVETLAPGQSEKTALEVPVPQQKEVTASSVVLEWEKIAGAGKYAYRLTGADDAEVANGETAALSVKIADLEAETEYRFAVRALAGGSELYDDSEWSADLTVKTLRAADPEPGPEPTVTFKFPAAEQDGVIRAFPGAEGAGMYTTGGRGGKVYHVTTLEDDESNRGSIRWIVQKCKEPRIVVFDVAGDIILNSDLKINTGDITILGQTAPGKGICLCNKQLSISANNVVIRYIRCRPGDNQSANPKDDGKAADGLDAMGARARKDVIIDHCSMSWSSDECASFYVMKNMTMQWCLMYESLRNGNHAKGSHGYGGIWGGAPASFHHNILAHHDSRNPRLEGPERYGDSVDPDANAVANGINTADRLLDMRNNVVYNFCNFGAYGGVGITMNFVGNYYKWGPASYKGCGPTSTGGANAIKKRQEFFMADNYYDGNGLKENGLYVQGNPSVYLGGNSNVLDTSGDDPSIGQAITADNKLGMAKSTGISPYLTFGFTWADKHYPVMADGKACSITTHSAQKAFDLTVKYCGASYSQDAADARVLNDVKNGLGTSGEKASGNKSWYGIIDTPADKGGYPALTATQDEIDRAKTDTDGDGIPDYYEMLFGLDPANAADAAQKTLDPQKLYTNFEVYAHYLVQDIVEAQNAGGDYLSLQ